MSAPIALTPSLFPTRRRTVCIRLALPADRPALASLLGGLSAATVERRFFMPRTLTAVACWREAERLTRGGTHYVLVAELPERAGVLVAVAELACRLDAPRTADSAIVVTDAYQSEGIGGTLAAQLGEVARRATLSTVVATVRDNNLPVRRMIASLGWPYTLRRWRGELQIEFAVAGV